MHKDRKAQKKLYEMYRVYLYGACMRYANNSMEAEDILQERFYRILKDLKQFKASSSLKTWMSKVMVNSALMYIRKHRKIKLSEFDDEAFEKQIKCCFHFFSWLTFQPNIQLAIIKPKRLYSLST